MKGSRLLVHCFTCSLSPALAVYCLSLRTATAHKVRQPPPVQRTKVLVLLCIINPHDLETLSPFPLVLLCVINPHNLETLSQFPLVLLCVINPHDLEQFVPFGRLHKSGRFFSFVAAYFSWGVGESVVSDSSESLGENQLSFSLTALTSDLTCLLTSRPLGSGVSCRRLGLTDAFSFSAQIDGTTCAALLCREVCDGSVITSVIAQSNGTN